MDRYYQSCPDERIKNTFVRVVAFPSIPLLSLSSLHLLSPDLFAHLKNIPTHWNFKISLFSILLPLGRIKGNTGIS